MGLLDLFSGAGGGSALSRMTSGMGGKGGFLQHMGLGQFGNQAGAQPPGMAGQLGQGKGWQGFLHGLGDQLTGGQGGQGGQQQAPPSAMPNLLPGGGGSQSPGLAELIAAYMKSNQRQ
jgi:hypothetical protein